MHMSESYQYATMPFKTNLAKSSVETMCAPQTQKVTNKYKYIILIYLWQFGHRLNISNQNSSTREHFGSETSSERGNFGVVKRPWCSKPLENCPSAVQQSHPFQQNLVYTEKYTDILHQRSPAWLWGAMPRIFLRSCTGRSATRRKGVVFFARQVATHTRRSCKMKTPRCRPSQASILVENGTQKL